LTDHRQNKQESCCRSSLAISAYITSPVVHHILVRSQPPQSFVSQSNVQPSYWITASSNLLYETTTSLKKSQYPVLADHMGNTGLQILAGSFQYTLREQDSKGLVRAV